jgi:hypothetical protein
VSVVLLLAGCAASADLTDIWTDPNANGTSIHRAFVFAMERDPAKRRIMEDAFAASLIKHGVEVQPSYRSFPSSVPDEDVIQDAIEHGGYDGVIAISRLDTKTETNYVPGYVSTEPRTHYDAWTGRYRTFWVDVHHPGYMESDEVARRRVDVWRPIGPNGEADLVWTAVGEVVDPTSSADVSRNLVERVVPELTRIRLLAKA